ncbi:MAG: type II toxin-antitoxin system RelE/ParE family toxin [Caulobacterales bacterium]|nr:type II toxin-antitoxin system RelE/ParE family toxin [Caulobacterales bacterium]
MTFRVRLSPQALADLTRLPAYLAPDSPAAADRARSLLVEALGSLEEFPHRGRPGRSASYRELPVPFGRSGYKIRYRVTGSAVLVTRIVHAREGARPHRQP